MYQKKQEKLLFQYISNSMLFSVPHENNGPLSSVNFLLTPHGSIISDRFWAKFQAVNFVLVNEQVEIGLPL